MKGSGLRLFALSILLAAGARSARADEGDLAGNSDTLDSDAVLRALVPYILTTDNMREERKNLVPLVVVDRGDSSNAIFDRDANRIVINRRILAASYSSLRSCANYPKGTPPENLLAYHLLPTVAHELRHVLLGKQLGGTPSNQEEEVAGFIETMAVYFELRGRHPEYYNCFTVYSTADWAIADRYWKPNGVDGLKTFVTQSPYYKQMCSVKKPEDIATCRKQSESLTGLEHDFWSSDERIAKALERYEGEEFPRGSAIWNDQKQNAFAP